MTTMLRNLFLFAAMAMTPGMAVAELNKISTKSEFMNLVEGKDLTIFAISVNVLPDGLIDGRAYGKPVRGKWRWQDGYFCRDLYWGTRDLGPNCQEVRVHGDVIRFTSDRGAGRFADLRMR